MDSFHAGWSFFFVPELEAECAVQGGPFSTVGRGEEPDEPAGLSKHGAHVSLRQRRRSVGRAFVSLDDGLRGGDVGLDLARLAGGKDRVHAGANCGEQPVELGAEAFLLTAGTRDLGRFGLAGGVRVEDGGNGGVEVVGTGERVEPVVDGGEDAFLAHHVGRRVVSDRCLGVVVPRGRAAVVSLVLRGVAEHRLAAVRAADGAGEQVAAGLGTRSAAHAGVAALVRDAGVDPSPLFLGHERRPALFLRPRPGGRVLPPLPGGRAERGVAGVDQFVMTALAADHLAAEVARVGEDGADGGAAPHTGRPRVAPGPDDAGAREAFGLECRRDRVELHPRVVHLEHSADDRRRIGVWLERAQLRARCCLGAVRVREAGVDEPVAVVRSTAEPASVGAEGEHRRARAVLRAPALALGQPTEDAHDHVVGFAVRVDRPADLGDPELDAVMGEHRQHELELRPGECALRLADHERVPSSGPVGDVVEEAGRLRPSYPRS